MNKRILIVDDETNVRLNFRMTLETEGYAIMEARSGEEAVQLLAEHPFALALLDLRLPGMDGLELLAKMRESGSRVPAVIIKKYYGQAIKLDKNYEPAQQNMRRLFEVDNYGSSEEPVNLGTNDASFDH